MENKNEEDDMCDTGLVLGLNYERCGNSSLVDYLHEKEANSFKYERSSFNCVPPGPSLSLALAVDDRACKSGKEYTGDDRSPRSGSKFGDLQQTPPKSLPPSSVYEGLRSKMVKKENDAGSEETERPFSHSSDEEEEGSVRKKLRLTKEQSVFLEDKFKEQNTLNPKQKQALAEQLNLRPRQVEVWFQNRRARTKLKQTKADRELLMKCCETLTDENRRLQKKLQELKLLKLSPGPPLIIQHPLAPGAAPFTKCPSCERVTGPIASKGAKVAGPVVVRPSKPHLLNPFAHSTTC